MSHSPMNHHAASPAAEAHRNAYNAAFEELTLNWRWDATTYARLQVHGRGLVRIYLEAEQSHLLRAYDADFLVNAIEAVKARCLGPAQGDLSRVQRPMHVAQAARHRRSVGYGVPA